jgi:hypothetical protein
VVEEIGRQLSKIAESQSPTASFARKISASLDRALILNPTGYTPPGWMICPAMRLQPDATFSHADARWPGVIIEVTDGEDTYKRNLMRRLANHYFRETKGEVQVVISFELEESNMGASISMWRPKWVPMNWTGEADEPILPCAQIVMDCEVCTNRHSG